MDRIYVRGIGNVLKKLLIQAACNLTLLLRSMHGARTPRAAHDQAVEAIFAILALTSAIASLPEPMGRDLGQFASSVASFCA